MGAAANAGHVATPAGKGENLVTVRDVLEMTKDRIRAEGETKAEVETLRSELATEREANSHLTARVDKLIDYCRKLDDQLPLGAKMYQAPTRSMTAALYQGGEAFTAARRMVRDHELMEGYTRAATQNEGAGGGVGATLVPQITYDALARIVGEGSIPRKISLMLPLTSNTMVMPVSATGPTIGYSNNYPAEAVAPSSEDSVSITSKTLTSSTLMVLDTVSLELSEDSLVAIQPLLAQIFGEAIAIEENRQAFSSSNPFTGIVQTSGIGYYYVTNTNNGGTTFANKVSHPDLVGCMAGVRATLINKGAWVMHPNTFASLVALKDTNGRPIFATAGGSLPTIAEGGGSPNFDVAANIPATLLGRPCYLTEAMPSTAFSAAAGTIHAIYGDFRYHAFALRKELSVEWNDSVYFTAGKSAVRSRGGCS